MGFVYYGIYAQYYEVGRVELLRSIGLSYKKIEEMGFGLPVVDFQISYKKPAFYDDELIIRTTINKLPTRRIIFNYETFNSYSDLLNTGEVVLVFVNRNTRKPCSPPDFLINKFKEKLR